MYRTHEMRMVQADESGFEEWACPTCGRRMLLRWPPDYEKRIIEPGDEAACHVGSDAEAHPPADTPATGSRCTGRWLRETGADTATTTATPP